MSPLLYLHGRGDGEGVLAASALPPPFELVAAQLPPDGLFAPIIEDAKWRDFRTLVAAATNWFEHRPSMVGHSMGAWLALAVCADLSISPSPMLLLAPVLGSVRIGGRVGVGFVPPREQAVHRYLMSLNREALAPVTIVAAESDPNTSPDMIDRLIQLGVNVIVVQSNHRLTEGAGPRALARATMDLRTRASGSSDGSGAG
jgi:hypothetical protein